MNKNSIGIIICYIISIVSVIAGWMVLTNGVSMDITGYATIAAGVFIGLAGAIYSFLKLKKWSATLILGILLLASALFILWDLYDEASNTYTDGFGAGNGVLLDGVSMVAYPYLGSVLFIIGIFLLATYSTRRAIVRGVKEQAPKNSSIK